MLGDGTSIGIQLAIQHRSRKCRLHKHYQKYPTKEEATTHPPDGIMVADWVVLYEKVRERRFPVLRSTPIALLALAISKPKLGLLIATANRAIGLLLKPASKVGCLKIRTTNKQNISFSEVPPTIGTQSVARVIHMRRKQGEVLRELQNDKASSSSTPVDICIENLYPAYYSHVGTLIDSLSDDDDVIMVELNLGGRSYM
ncbi:hypothetical protein Tco_0205301 [Tanacetum coccineum]